MKIDPRLRSAVEDLSRAMNLKITKTEDTSSNTDLFDMNRGWGWRLLPENDPAFSESSYLFQFRKLNKAEGLGESLLNLSWVPRAFIFIDPSS
ncbi:MAG: hypothetical protein ACK5P6_01615 [Pseudobdellovibrionaceae bacterium]